MCSERLASARMRAFKCTSTEGIIDAMRDETSSLYCVADNQSAVSTRSMLSETSIALDTSFDFDAEILSSRIYGITYRSHLRQTMTSAKSKALPVVQAAVLSEEDTSGSLGTTPYPIDPLENIQKQHLQPLVAPRLSPHTNELSDAVTATGKAKTTLLVQDVKLMSLNVDMEQDSNFGPETCVPSSIQKSSCSVTAEASIETTEIDPVPVLPVKVILMGVSESGKSTILKGIQLHAEGPYTHEERLRMSGFVYSNLVQSVRTVLEIMKELRIPFDSIKSEKSAYTIFEQPWLIQSLPPKVYDAILSLACDRSFQACLKRRDEYQLNDNMDMWENQCWRKLCSTLTLMLVICSRSIEYPHQTTFHLRGIYCTAE